MRKRVLLASFVFITGVIGGFFVSSIIYQSEAVDYSLISPLPFGKDKLERIGFLPYWLVDKAAESYKDSLTTVVYFSLTVNPDGTIQKKVNAQEEEPGWTTFKKSQTQSKLARVRQEGLKTSLLIFGLDESHIFQLMENPETSAQNLMEDVSPLMQEYSFNDLNIDIESFLPASPSAQSRFTLFLKTIKERLVAGNLGTLTVEITPVSLIRPRLTDSLEVGKIADFVVLMAYDYHHLSGDVSGPVAPLGGSGQFWDNDVTLSIERAVKVIPPEKLILGIPLYGYEWETIDNSPRSPVIPWSGKTASGRRVEEILKDCQNCIQGTDPEGKQPFVIIPEENYFRQIFYENKESLAQKLKLVNKYKLGGVAFWALGYEDTEILKPLRILL